MLLKDQYIETCLELWVIIKASLIDPTTVGMIEQRAF